MSRPIRVLELRSVRGTGGGPEKTILLGAERSDPDRFAVTVCYIRDDRDEVFGIDRKAGALPIDYVEVRERHSFDPGVWKQLRQIIRDKRIDIVHGHEYKTDLLAWLLARVEPVAPMATAHGWTGHSSRERWVYYPADKKVLSWMPRVVAVSSDIKNELVRFGANAERITTILNGIDHRRFRREPERAPAIRAALGLTPDDFVIGSVGRAEPQKRFDLLIEAFAQLRTAGRRLRLLIAGDGSLREALAAQVARLGLQDAVMLLGHRTDVADLHHAMDLFVQSSDYEGTPNAVLEAMALETPLVATDVGGTAEVARSGQDAVIVAPGSADVLVRAIDGAVVDTNGLRVRAASARRRVETVLSFDARMDALERIYTELFEAQQQQGRTAAAVART
ncbi:MAG: glycosyltransferase [Acidobacteria bacterium]|nr:glycosyltransferase [Acidobacteriota bacterium]